MRSANRCRSTMSRWAARIRVDSARPCWAARSQNTASRFQWFGTGEVREATRMPSATSAPNWARLATARSTRAVSPRDSAAATVKAASGCAPILSSLTTTSRAAAISCPSRRLRRLRRCLRIRAAISTPMTTHNTSSGSGANTASTATTAAATTARPNRSAGRRGSLKRRTGGAGAASTAAASSTAAIWCVVTGRPVHQSTGRATPLPRTSRGRPARPGLPGRSLLHRDGAPRSR